MVIIVIFETLILCHMELKRTFDILDNLLKICPEKDDMLAGKEKGNWIKYSVKEYVGWQIIPVMD